MILKGLLLFLSANCDSAEYFRFVDKYTLHGDKKFVTDSFKYDEDNQIIWFNGGTGVYLPNDCLENYKCFEYNDIIITVPINCELLKMGQWDFKDYKYRIVELLDEINLLDKQSVHKAKTLVSITKSHTKVGYFIYSNNSGVHAFSFKSKKLKPKKLEFFKTSLIGMLNNGCVLSMDNDKFPPKLKTYY